MEVKKLNNENVDQFIELIRLFEQVFEMEHFVLPNKLHLQKLLQQESFYAFAAVQDDKVVGGVTAYTMTQYYSMQEAVYLFDLAVDATMQRQGIGKKLMTTLNEYCKKAGAEVVFLEADEEDIHAQEFYRATGASEAKVFFYSYELNDHSPKQ